MSEQLKGVIAMTLACTVWGLSALYYKLIAHVPPLEVLSHRTIWSAVFLIAMLAYSRRLPEILTLFRNGKSVLLVAIAALMISVNWATFIWAVQVGRVTESSLGYYIFPLIAALLGAVFLRERLSRGQQIAVGLATLAVMMLTFGLGVAPYVSMVLAVSMAFYGLVKKPLRAGPVVSVLAEVLILIPLAAIWLWGVHTQDWIGFTGRTGGFFHTPSDIGLLMLAGPLTGGPLVLMSYALKRLRLTTVGLVQYVNPTLQFLVATVILLEPFTFWHIGAFAMIWTALAIYSADSMRNQAS